MDVAGERRRCEKVGTFGPNGVAGPKGEKMCGGAAAEARGRAASTKGGVGWRRGSIDERDDSTKGTSGRGDWRLKEARERQRKDRWRLPIARGLEDGDTGEDCGYR